MMENNCELYSWRGWKERRKSRSEEGRRKVGGKKRGRKKKAGLKWKEEGRKDCRKEGMRKA